VTRSALVLSCALLVVLGAGWGATQPLSKIAVSTGHGPLGLIFWQAVIGALAMGGVLALRGRRFALTPARLVTMVIIALIGTILPNSASFQAIAHLPAGVHSVLMSLVPLVAFPIALGLGLESFRARRLLGLLLGLSGVMVLVLPKASLPEPALLIWIPLSLFSVFCYAAEGNYVARWGTNGLDPVELMFGASVIAAGMALPLALSFGQFVAIPARLGAAEWALIASSVIHVMVYAGYVWMVGRAGPVFTAQVGYLVTAFGVLFAMIFLAESYSGGFWLAAALILSGVVLVQPRREDAVAHPVPMTENGAHPERAAKP